MVLLLFDEPCHAPPWLQHSHWISSDRGQLLGERKRDPIKALTSTSLVTAAKKQFQPAKNGGAVRTSSMSNVEVNHARKPADVFVVAQHQAASIALRKDRIALKKELHAYCKAAVHNRPFHFEFADEEAALNALQENLMHLNIQNIEDLQNGKDLLEVKNGLACWMYEVLYESKAVAAAFARSRKPSQSQVIETASAKTHSEFPSPPEAKHQSRSDQVAKQSISKQSISSLPPFSILPICADYSDDLSDSMKRASGFNQFDRPQRQVRFLVAQNMRESGSNLYQFVPSPERNVGSNCTTDEWSQVSFMEHCDKVEGTSEWAGHTEIAVAAKIFEATIFIWQRTATGYRFLSRHGNGKYEWHLGYYSEFHYDLLIHCSDAAGLRRLLPYLGAAPSVMSTTSFRGSTKMLAMGMYGDGSCFYACIAACVIMSDHPIAKTLACKISPGLVAEKLTSSTLSFFVLSNSGVKHLTSSLTGGDRILDLDELKVGHANIMHLFEAAGYPLSTPSSVVYDGTSSLCLSCLAPLAHDTLKCNNDTVFIACVDDQRRHIAINNVVKSALHEGHQNFPGPGCKLFIAKSPLPTAFDQCTHAVFDSPDVPAETVLAALRCPTVQIVICHSRTDQIPLLKYAEESGRFFRVGVRESKENDIDPANNTSTITTTLYMYVRNTRDPEVQSSTKATRPSVGHWSEWIRKATCYSASEAMRGAAMGKIVPHYAGTEKDPVIAFRLKCGDIKMKVIPNVPVSVFDNDGFSNSYMPNELILLDKTAIVTYRGMMEICGSSGSFRVLYEEHCSRGVIRNAVVHRVSPSSEQIDHQLLDSTFIAKSSKKFLSLEFRNVTQNSWTSTSASSSDAISASDSEGVGGNKEPPHGVVKNLTEDFEKTDKAKGVTPDTDDSATPLGDQESKTDKKRKLRLQAISQSPSYLAVPKPRTNGKKSPSADDSATPLGNPSKFKLAAKIAKDEAKIAKELPSADDSATPLGVGSSTGDLDEETPDNAEDGFAVPKPTAKIAKDEAKIAKDEATKRANQAKVDLKTAETIGNLKTAHSQMKTLLKSAKEDYHRVDKRNRDMAKEIEAAKKSKTEVQPTQTQVPEQLSDRNELKELLTDLKVMHGDFKKTQVDMQTEKIVTAVEKNKPVELAEVMKSIVCVQKSMFEGMSSVIKSVVPSRDHHEARPVVAPAVVCIKDLEGKKLSKWTVEDVQRWLDHSNQPGLRPLAGKNYVDGASLILLGDNPCLCSDIWPSLSAFEKIRIQQSIVQCRAAYEHL
jgi:hypothetical protein